MAIAVSKTIEPSEHFEDRDRAEERLLGECGELAGEIPRRVRRMKWYLTCASSGFQIACSPI